MAYVHVEDSKPPGDGSPFTGYGNSRTKSTSTTTFGHSIYRCYGCKALWVGKIGEKPSGPCSKCKAR